MLCISSIKYTPTFKGETLINYAMVLHSFAIADGYKFLIET